MERITCHELPDLSGCGGYLREKKEELCEMDARMEESLRHRG